jgi:serine/threonine-protein kinase
VRSLFRHASDLGGSERARYLAEACAGDAALRNEVEGLLARAAVDTEALRPRGSPPPVAPPAVPGLRFERELGRGGMGVVFLALDEATGLRVAVKALHPWLSGSARSLERFRREAEIGVSVRHKNLVPTLAYGAAGDQAVVQHFLVLEYVEG